MNIRIVLAVLLLQCISSRQATGQSVQPNILFIVIDDLNDYMPPFEGHEQAVAPTLREPAQQGTVFQNAFAASPKCMPSRMAMLTGKTPYYTEVYRNMACKPIRDYTDLPLLVLPEYLKDSAGYFTYGAGKIVHCYDTYPEYDTETADACAKSLSWNKYILFPGGEQPDVKAYGDSVTVGQGGLRWTPIPDSMEKMMWDYQATDSLIAFIHAVGSGSEMACGKPLLLTIG